MRECDWFTNILKAHLWYTHARNHTSKHAAGCMDERGHDKRCAPPLTHVHTVTTAAFHAAPQVKTSSREPVAGSCCLRHTVKWYGPTRSMRRGFEPSCNLPNHATPERATLTPGLLPTRRKQLSKQIQTPVWHCDACGLRLAPN